MHWSVRVGLLALATALPLAAQNGNASAASPSCPVTSLNSFATTAASLRSQLRREAVPADDPTVPPRIAALLVQFKDALTQTALAAFRCAPASASADQLQTTLAGALHANQPSASETAYEARGRKDVGAFGSDLNVQVFQLFGRPKIFQVDLRYGIECGDDNLLLVFETPSEDAGNTWQQTLRWDAPRYSTVADALGDFVLLTPLTGSYEHPTWRYLVAHGHPSCAETPHPSRFNLDLLTPNPAAPANPTPSWHFDGAYSQGNTIPRLTTTEDTIDFRILPAPPATEPPLARNASKKTQSAPANASATAPLPAEQIFRFRFNSNGDIVPVTNPEPSAATNEPPAQ